MPFRRGEKFDGSGPNFHERPRPWAGAFGVRRSQLVGIGEVAGRRPEGAAIDKRVTDGLHILTMSLDRTIAALGDPTRREILRRLADAPRRAGELASGFAISRPAICKHTRLLTGAGLIRAKRSGRERIYELAPSGGREVRKMIEQLEDLERFWDVALEAFKRYVEKGNDGSQVDLDRQVTGDFVQGVLRGNGRVVAGRVRRQGQQAVP